nr:hypothetical protein [uncultured Actinoplanes sp.]
MRIGAGGGLVCGTVTALAMGGVFAALDEYQVADMADHDATIGVAGGFCAGAAAMLTVAVLRTLRRGRWPAGQVFLPVMMVPAVLTAFVSGAERDQLETAALWAVAAMVMHLLIGGVRWTRAVPGVAAVCAVAVLASWGRQHRWRAHKFEALGLAMYVPQVAGYRLTGTYAGRSHLIERLTDDSGHGIDVWIGRDDGGCAGGLPWCLPGGARMTLVPAPGADIAVREVEAWFLAGFPDDGTVREPD